MAASVQSITMHRVTYQTADQATAEAVVGVGQHVLCQTLPREQRHTVVIKRQSELKGKRDDEVKGNGAGGGGVEGGGRQSEGKAKRLYDSSQGRQTDGDGKGLVG